MINFFEFQETNASFSLKYVQRKLDIAGTATEMHLLLFQSINRPFQIQVAHFDQNRTIRY